MLTSIHSLPRWRRLHLDLGEHRAKSFKLGLSAFGQHAPGDDQYGYEDAGERWMPVHTVETIVRLSSIFTTQKLNRHIPYIAYQCHLPFIFGHPQHGQPG